MKHYIKNNKLLFFLTIVLSVSSTIIWVYFSKLMEYIIDGTSNKTFIKNIIIVIVYIGIVRLLSYFGNITKSIFINKTIQQLKSDYLKSAFQKDFLSDSGEVLTDLETKLTMIRENYLENYVVYITSIISFVLSTILLMKINFIITIVLYILLIIVIFLPNIMKSKLEKFHLNNMNDSKTFITSLKDFLSGFDVIKSNNLENYVNEKLDKEINNVKNSNICLERINYQLAESSHFFITLLGAAGFVLGSYYASIGKMTYGTVIAIVQLTNTLSSPLYTIVENIGKLIGSKALVDGILKKIEYIKSMDHKKIIEEINTIEFQDVSYCVDGKYIVRNINLCFKKNCKYLLIGESGSGKTTILNLIVGKYHPTSGVILINGIDINEIDSSCLVEKIGIINQDVHIFDGSIKDNITLFDKYSYPEDIIEKVKLTKYIQSLKDGMNTITSENGMGISGGEKQRISIARILTSKKEFILVDEPTSALDKETSKAIEQTLLDCCHTLIHVSHKFNEDLIGKYDFIIEVDNGTMK